MKKNPLFFDREREETIEDTKHNISEDNKVVKDDATVINFVDDEVKPVFEEENNLDKKATSDEEFDCSSVTVSSEGERRIAALDEKSRRLKAQFAEENRLAIESMDKIREEIKQSQEREDAITNDMEEMRHRQDEIKQDLRRLDEISKRRDLEEEKWKAKIDKKKKKIARRLEKVRADRLEYQQETEAENETPENQNGAGIQLEQERKDATEATTCCVKEDASNNILYEPHEVKEYSNVKQLEKKRKELRRLEKMEKKAIKREKLEQRERKRIEKEKRKVARKLEKLRVKNSAVTEKNLASSQDVSNQGQDASSASLLQGNSEEPQAVNRTEHQTTHFTATCDVDQEEQDASSDRDPTEEHSSLHAREVRPSVSNGVLVEVGDSELDISEDVKEPILDSIICETKLAELAPEDLKLQNEKYVATERSVGEEMETTPYNEFVMENSKQSSLSGDNQMNNEDASEDIEIDCLEKEDTLKDISVELFSIEEELGLIEPHNNPKCGGEREKNFKSEECASTTAGMEYDELSSLQEEILVSNSSEREVVSTATDRASGKLEKMPSFVATNTSTLAPAVERLDNISVYSVMASDEIPPLCSDGREELAKTEAFDQIDGGGHNNDGPLQCLDDRDVELYTRSKEHKSSGDSLEKSAPQPEYVKEDGNHVLDDFVNDGNDETIDMTLSDEDFDNGDPSGTEDHRLLASEPSPLNRKVSGRFTPGGLRPLFNSHGTGEFNSIFEDTIPSEEVVEDKVGDEDGQFTSEENSPLHHLETGTFEDQGSVMTPDEIPPLCFDGKETLAKSDAFDQVDGGGHDNDLTLQCLHDTDVQLSTHSTENNSVPRPEYVEDGNDVPVAVVDSESEDAMNMTLSDESFHRENPSCIENGSLVANDPSPLMRKVSGRFTPGGLQPLFNSPGTGEFNSIFEDTIPSEEEVEDKVVDDDGQFTSEENSPLHHLETESFEEETWSHDHDIRFKDLPKEMQEALVKQYAACTDLEGAENVQVDIIYEEVSRRSSDPNSFSIVCEEASVQTCDQESWMEQDIVEEIDDVSIKEPSLREERTLAFLKCDEMKMKQESVDDIETKPEVELGGSGRKVGCDHHELRQSIDELGVMEFSQPPLTASEALSVEPSTVHSPDLQSSTCRSYNKGALPEDLKPIPLKAASKAKGLENVPLGHFHKYSDHSSSHQKAYNSQSIEKRNFQEDDFIAEFDDFLDEVEEAFPVAENQDSAKTVDASKVVGAFAQSTVESTDKKTQEGLPDHDSNKSMEKARGLKEETSSHKEIYEDFNIPLLLSNRDTNNKPLAEYKEAFHHSHSHQSGNGEDVEKALLDRNLDRVIKTPKELDSSALFNDALQSDYSGDRDDYALESRASNDKNLLLISENKDIHNRGEVSGFAYCMEGSLTETKVQDEQRLLMDLDATNKKNEQVMEENAQSVEDSSHEKEGYDSSKNSIEVSGIATETSRADGVAARARDESPVSEIQEMLREEDSKVEKSHSICDTGDELDSWGSIDDMLTHDSHCVIGGKEESVSGAPYLPEVVNKGSNYKNEEEDGETLELETSSASALECTAVSPGRHRDSLLSPRKDENISVVGEHVKSTNNEVCALKIEKDTELNSVGDLALPGVSDVKKGASSAHQDISDLHVDNEVLKVGQEVQSIEYHKQSVLKVAPGMDRSCQKDNKATASDVKANGGDGFVSVDSTMDERLDTSLEDKFSQVDIPSKEVSQRPHATKILLSGKGKVRKAKLKEDEFIDDFDRLLDEVEEDIRSQESLSSLKSNSYSSEAKKAVEEIEDQSIIDVETLDESVSWVTDIDNVESLLSSCDEEVAAINASTLEMITEDEGEPDSWNALDELVGQRFQNRDSSFVLNDGENRVSDEHRRANYERRIAAVVNISEYLLQQELMAAVKAAASEITSIDVLEDEVKQIVTKHRVQQDDIKRLTEDKIQAHVANKETSVTVSKEEATVGDAIEQLNKLDSMVTDIREQLSGRNGTKRQRFAVKTEMKSVPVLLNSINTLDYNIGEMAEELKQATEKSNKGSVKSDEHVGMEILEEKRKENAKMLIEITMMQEEVVAFKKKNESLHSELEETKAELKCHQSRDEYKQRELTNLKIDFERKEKKWDDAEESLENALKDKLELLDDVEYLEDSLRISRENNEKLNDSVDELNKTIKGLMKRAKMDNKRHEYGHLREEVELLKGSLELSNQREGLLRCQVDDLEGEVSHFKYCEQTLKSNLETVKIEKSRIIEQLEEQLSVAENENTRMTAELSRASGKESLLSELEKENRRVLKQLQDQLNKLTFENSALNAELCKVSEKDNQITELKSETTKVIKRLEEQLANLKKDNHNLETELCKVSEKDREMTEFKGETSKLVNKLEDQLAALKKENFKLATELHQASEKDNQMRELKRETSKVIKKLEDQLATLKKENSTLATELSKASKKDNQMSELQSETSNVIKQLEGQLARLRKENSTLVTKLSKVWEKDKQLTELCNQVENLATQNKLLQDQALQAKKQFSDKLKCPQEETSELGEGSMRTRSSRRSKSSDIKKLRKRVRQNEQELEFLGRFIRQRGLEFERRPPYHINPDLKGTSDELPNLKETSNNVQNHERAEQNTSQVREMEKVIEDIRKTLRQTEYDLHQTKDALKVKTERTEFLERRIEETEMLLEETSWRLRQNQCNLERTDATLRQQLERSETLKNQLQEMENARNTALTSIMNKEQELEEAYRRICQKDQRIDDIFGELKQERFDKECLKTAIEVKECNAVREKGLLKTLRELENQLQRTEELKETTSASLMDKQQELEQLYRSVSAKNAEIDDLTLELKQEKLDKDYLKRTIALTECDVNKQKGLLERTTQLEKKLQETQELREKTLVSLKNSREALEQASDKTDELNQRLKQEISDKQCLRRAVEATECNAKREKELLGKRRTELEIRIQEMEKLQERTQSSLKDKETELQQVYTKLSRKDDTIDELKQDLKQERSEKRELRKAMERKHSNAQRQKILLDGREEEVERLKEQLSDYEKKVEKLNGNLKQMRTELEVAEDMLSYRQDNVGNAGISSRIQYDHLQVFPTKQSRHTKESFREMGSLMVHVADRLNKLVQRQKEVDSSAALLKQKDAEAKRVVERLRGELNQRDDELESLKSSLLKSATEVECTRGRLREVEYENIDLKKNLADESDQVKKLEILVKQLEGDVQRAQNSLKVKDTTLEETKESLQLKRSLLTSMEAKLCLKDNEIEELRVVNKERSLELERAQTSLKEVKKELESSSSIITKQNEKFVHLRSSVNRKTWEADKMKFRMEPTHHDVKLLSIQLECAKNDKESLSRELEAATVRFEKEQILADRQKKALQEHVKFGLEDLKDKTKLIRDMKMSLQESTARISRLEVEKLEQGECFEDYKRKPVCGIKQLKQSLNMANENERLWHSGMESAEREMSELRKENQRLKCELQLKETGKFTQDGREDKVRLAFVVFCCILVFRPSHLTPQELADGRRFSSLFTP